MKARKVYFKKWKESVTCVSEYYINLRDWWFPTSYIKRHIPKEWNMTVNKEKDSLIFLVTTKAVCSKEDIFDFKTGVKVSKAKNLRKAHKMYLWIINFLRSYYANRYKQLAFMKGKCEKQLKKYEQQNNNN